MGPPIHLKNFNPELFLSKEIQGQRVEQRLKERPFRDCPTWGSIPHVDNKSRRYCECQEVLADRSLLQLSLERLCQILTNTDADGCLQPTFKLNIGVPMEELGVGLKELKEPGINRRGIPWSCEGLMPRVEEW